MKKSFIILMSIAGFASMQASNESNLTKMFRSSSLTDVELTYNPCLESPRNRSQSTFQAIQAGKFSDAGEIVADLVAEGKMTQDQVVRATMQSPISDQVAFAQAYNLRNRMNSPYYVNLQNALSNPAYSNDEKTNLQGLLNEYLSGVKVTSLKIPSPKNR